MAGRRAPDDEASRGASPPTWRSRCATGAVGREFIHCLEERDFPVQKLTLLASPRSEGEKLEFNGADFTLRQPRATSLCVPAWIALALALSAAAPAAPVPSAPSDLPDPNDPLERLYGRKSLSFDKGMPSVSVMLMEAQSSVTFTTKGRMRLLARGGLNKTLEAPAGSTWTLTLKNYEPGETLFSIQVAEHAFSDKDDLAETKKLWGEERGYKVRTQTTGSLHGIAGHVLDNRRQLVLIGDATAEEKAKEILKELHAKFGFQGMLLPALKKRPHGLLEIADASGTVLAVAQDLASATSPDKGPFLVKEVEHGRGYKSHGRQDRSFRGDLEFVVDRAGGIAVVNLVPMESYLRGIVASEIFAKAHPEALKAQAVTARGEVLAKLGTRHLTDPYLLCAEQHCQVYTGLSGEAASTDAAVAATAGQTLFAPAEKGGGLVDSVYSAVCGGHSEDNEAVWGGIPDPMLRGRTDLVEKSEAFDAAITDQTIKDFVSTEPAAYCSVSTFSKKQKYRWEKRFTRAEVDKIAAPFGVGKVQVLAAAKRGSSGRVTVLTIAGEDGATQVRGELVIRRLFANLNSALFMVEPPGKPHPDEWVFRGAGWGHGVGMCQTGAIGRAEQGQTYQEILRHYFNGAEIVGIY
ncbi:MAG TPA: SpoIID/LytB domain-containing protein [Myxococcales bacterium]|jgi:SpoIID/LytB domain protein